MHRLFIYTGKKNGYTTLIFYFTCITTANKSVIYPDRSQLPNPYCHLLILKALCHHKQDFCLHCPDRISVYTARQGLKREGRLERQINSLLEEKSEPKPLPKSFNSESSEMDGQDREASQYILYLKSCEYVSRSSEVPKHQMPV